MWLSVEGYRTATTKAIAYLTQPELMRAGEYRQLWNWEREPILKGSGVR